MKPIYNTMRVLHTMGSHPGECRWGIKRAQLCHNMEVIPSERPFHTSRMRGMKRMRHNEILHAMGSNPGDYTWEVQLLWYYMYVTVCSKSYPSQGPFFNVQDAKRENENKNETFVVMMVPLRRQ